MHVFRQSMYKLFQLIHFPEETFLIITPCFNIR